MDECNGEIPIDDVCDVIGENDDDDETPIVAVLNLHSWWR
jgi:hypothetical protein